ncbi:MAG: hypothetical protein WAM30_19980, partial [Candidatus Dormiibacterota bacterium]
MIRRLRWGHAFACLLLALALVGCSPGATSSTTASGARLADPTVTSRAITLRTSVDLALSAHVMLLARTTGAALGVRTDEFTAFGTDVHQNATNVADAIAPQNTEGNAQISQTLTLFDQSTLTYTTATFKKDTPGQQGAQSAMTTVYQPQMVAALGTATGVKSATVTPLVAQQIQDELQIANDQANGNWVSADDALNTAYQHAVAFGDALARAEAKRSPRQYPGNAASKAAGFRVLYETQLQEQAYQTAMVEGAAVGQRTAEQQAAAQAQSAAVAATSQGFTTNVPTASSNTTVASGLQSSLTALYGQALAYAQAAAGKQPTTAPQAGLQQTFPGYYLQLAHGTLGVKPESSNS